jgi:hypothetical protein
VWIALENGREPSGEGCQQGDHTWVAFFFESGRLAYWRCDCCGKADRETEPLPERLEWFNGWVKSPPRLVARGPSPPASTRRWETAKGAILVEGDPSSIHHVGVRIPGLTEAHTYALRNQDGKVEAVYEPGRERLGPYSDHYWLTRYQVVGEALVRFVSHCYEESTYDVPFAGQPKQTTLLSELRLLPAGNCSGEWTRK